MVIRWFALKFSAGYCSNVCVYIVPNRQVAALEADIVI